MGEDRLQRSKGTWGNQVLCGCGIYVYTYICEDQLCIQWVHFVLWIRLPQNVFEKKNVWQHESVVRLCSSKPWYSAECRLKQHTDQSLGGFLWTPTDTHLMIHNFYSQIRSQGKENKCPQECSQGLAPARLEATHLSVCRKADKACGVVVWQQDVWIWKYPEQKKWIDNRA